MVSEFGIISDDFEAELAAIEGMIASLSTTGQSTTSAQSRVAGANAASLLLAATFEEFIRQQVRAVFKTKAKAAKGIDDFPPKIAPNVWRRSLERLARIPFEDVLANSRDIDGKINSTRAFCIGRDLDSDVSDAVAHNDNNMRPGELNRLFNQLGLTNMIGKAAENPPLVQFLGCESAGKAAIDLASRLDDFFRRRNEIAHAIKLNSSSGPPALAADIEFFRAVAKAITSECERFCSPPNDEGAPPPPDSPEVAAS